MTERPVLHPSARQRKATAAAPVSPAVPAARPGVLSWKGVLLGSLLLWPNAVWVQEMEIVRGSAHPTTVSLYFNAIFILLVVTLANHSLARFRRRWALSRADLLVVYTMVAIGSSVAGHDALEILVPMLAWPWRFASGSNHWEAHWFQYLPKWAMVSDKEAMEGYFTGNSTIYTWSHLHAWLIPLLVWVAFVTTLLFVMQCVNVLLRKQWTEHERLSYPIIQLPLELTAGVESGRLPHLFSNRLFWFGFAIAAAIDLINGLNLYYPAVPPILRPGFGRSYLDLHPFFPDRPLSAIGWTPAAWFSWVVGVGMLLPLDFLFSSWFFYLYWKALAVATVALSFDSDPRAPYSNMQAFGAYMAFLVSSLWISRGYFQQVGRVIMGQQSRLDDHGEPLRYRSAALGAVLGTAALVGFSTLLGIPWWIGIAFFAIYLALAIAITRMRAELGTPVHDLHFTGPDWVLAEVGGTQSFAPQTLAGFSLYFWFNRAYRGHPMPHQLEGLKLAEVTGSSQRRWFGALLLAAALGALAGFWSMLHLYYHYGATAKAHTFGSEAYTRLDGWITSPRPPKAESAVAILVGFGIALFLQAMRTRYPWWPFHPLGFAVTSSWEINLVWLSLFIAWVLKLTLLRYGGRQGFSKSIPFFMGLILGQFVVGSLWNLYGIAAEVPTYQFLE
jgi:Family of unknown function (DUF6785)/Domain of unknown function (DUF6784)